MTLHKKIDYSLVSFARKENYLVCSHENHIIMHAMRSTIEIQNSPFFTNLLP
uniref:Uncharacterized protein n=1 Tax=Arundo donax TaxID=35708 RepID=A0A0A8YGT8_ARUDO